jgi:WD40 repeat protein
VRVWEVATGKAVRTLSHGAPCWAVLSPDGKWLATTGGRINKKNNQWEGSVKLWDFRTGEEKQTLPELKDPRAIVFSPDRKRLAVGDGSTVRIWDLEKAAFEK